MTSVTHITAHSIHYSDVIMSTMASPITNRTIVFSTIYSGADQRNHQSSASRAFARGIHWWQVNSLHKGPVTPIMFPFDDVIMYIISYMTYPPPRRASLAIIEPWQIQSGLHRHGNYTSYEIEFKCCPSHVRFYYSRYMVILCPFK